MGWRFLGDIQILKKGSLLGCQYAEVFYYTVVEYLFFDTAKLSLIYRKLSL